ncbi:MAG TPA: hypothetical protein VIZ58_09270, partial [Thermoanaerobaculia bacterium]
MKRFLALLAAGFLASSFAAAQRKPAPPAGASAPRGPAAAPKAEAAPAPEPPAEDATSGRGYTY